MSAKLFKRLRKPGFSSVFISGMLSNIIVFAEPVNRASANLLIEKNTSLQSHDSYGIYRGLLAENQPDTEHPVALDGEGVSLHSENNTGTTTVKENFEPNVKKPHESPDALSKRNNRHKIYKPTEAYFVFYADEKQGSIGKAEEFQHENPKDNYFTITLPETLAIDNYDVKLTYDLYGLSSASQTTKSINGNDAYGGNIIVRNERWNEVEEYVSTAFLKPGENKLFFTRRADETYTYHVKNVRFQLAYKQDSPFIKLSEKQLVNLDGVVHILGFAATDEVRQIRVSDVDVPVKNGIFEWYLEDVHKKTKTVEISYEVSGNLYTERFSLASGTTEQKIEIFDGAATSASSAITLDEEYSTFNFHSAKVEASFTSEKNSSQQIFIKGLAFKDLKPLNYDLINVTSGDYDGYRIISHQKPDSTLYTLHIAYDENKIPSGYTAKDIRTFYYDTENQHWKALPVESIDRVENSIAVLVTDPGGETDYINGIIKSPEHPETSSFVPTAMSDIDFANPSAGVVSIPPPSPNNMGGAGTSFPIKLPPGRNGMQPSVEVAYNSEGGNGWMGMGWDVQLPAIQINTKWGVPVFNQTMETELYSLNGQDLVIKDNSDYYAPHRSESPITRNTNHEFYLRKEGNYLTIKRYGNSTTNYRWEVTDKFGNKSFYGGDENDVVDEAVIKDPNGHIVQWALYRQEDTFENHIIYEYDKFNTTLAAGVSAQEFYPSKISYTLHPNPNIDQNYEVHFRRNQYTVADTGQTMQFNGRSDQMTQARMGFLQSTSSLLTEIEVRFGSTPIRTYRFDYKEGPFQKQLLERISEFDTGGKLFYSNTFEYYDDIESNSIISESSTDWNGNSENISSPLHNIATGGFGNFIPKGSALGTSVSSGTSIGFRAGIGIGTNYFSVRNSAGGSFNSGKNTMRTRISFIDINGDGLPDKVYYNGSAVLYRPNTGDGFGNLIPVTGIDNLDISISRTSGFGFDVNAAGLIGVGKSRSKTKTTTDHYFADINGDGLPDLISNNRVRFNVTSPNSDPQMRLFGTGVVQSSENPIVSGIIDEELLEHLKLESMEELREQHPQFDHVKVWKAPYKGTVNITSEARLIAKNIDADNNDNTFRLTIEKGGHQQTNGTTQQLGSDIVFETPTTNFTTINRTTSVDKGDLLFFRIHNTDNGYGGEIEWNPEITYTATDYFPFTTHNDENGKPFHHFNAVTDYIMNNSTEWSPHIEDTSISINFNLSESHFDPYKFSDDLRFVVQKNAIDLSDGTVTPVAVWEVHYNHHTGQLSGNTAAITTSVNTSDEKHAFNFYVESNSNVAWEAIKWTPMVTGTYTGVAEPSVDYYIYDNNTNQVKYWINGSQLIDPLIDPQDPQDAQNPLMVFEHNMFDLNFSNLINNNFNENEQLPIKINWVVKENIGNITKVLYDKTFYFHAIWFELPNDLGWIWSLPKFTKQESFSSEEIDPETDTDYFQYTLTKEQVNGVYDSSGRIYSSFYINNSNFGKNNPTTTTLQLHDNAQGYTFNPVSLIGTFFSYDNVFYGTPYRGWGQFLYNGGLAFEYDEEGEIITNSNSPAYFDQLMDMKVFDFESGAQDIEDQVEETDPDNVSNDDGPVRLMLYTQHPAEQSFENKTIMTSKYGYNSGSIISATVGRFAEANIHELYVDPDDLINDNGTSGIFVGFKQRTESKGKAKSGNLATFQGTESESTSNVLNQYIDLNGDRYPDIVTGGMIQYTNMLGGYSTLTKENDFVSGSFNKDETYGVTISGMNPNSNTEGHKKNPIISNASSGINAGDGNTSDVRQWTDMNGDGLPDQVRIEGDAVKVWLNTGYGFTNEITWGSGYDELLTSTRINGSLGPSFPFSASFAAGFGGGISTAGITTTLQDVNGDGLPDLIIKSPVSFHYLLNTGTAFDNDLKAFYNSNKIEEDVSVSGSIYGSATFGFPIPIPFIPVKAVFTPSLGANTAFSEKTITLQDINGDGLPDVLQKKAGNSSVSAKLNRVGKTNLLQKVNTPLGGSWEIDYSRVGNTYNLPHSKWVLSRITTHDGFEEDSDFAPDETLATIVYENGKHDRREREFLGFETLVIEQRDPSSEELFRYTEKKFHTGSYYLKGAVKEAASYSAAGDQLTLNRTFYNLLKPEEPVVNSNVNIDDVYIQQGAGNPDFSRLFAAPVKSISTQFEDGQSLNLVQEYSAYDGAGNLTSYINYGSGYDDAYRTNIKYAEAAFPGLPSLVRVFRHHDNTLLRHRDAEYTANGKLYRIHTGLGDNETNRVEFVYDVYGNVTQIKQLDNLNATGGHFTQNIGYDNTLKTYPTTFSDAFNQQSSAVYNYLFGTPVLVTDANDNSIRTRIDNRGRVIEVTGPYELPGGWTIRKQYKGEDPVQDQIGASGPEIYQINNAKGSFKAAAPGGNTVTNAQHYAITRHFDPLNNGNEMLTISIVDGFGKAIQLKKTHFSNQMKWQVSGYEKKDAYGRVLEQYLPMVQEDYPNNLYNLSSTHLSYFENTSNLPDPVEITYDVRDRQTQIKQPGESQSTAITYSIQDGMFTNKVTNELDQTQETFTDIRGRNRKVVQNDEIVTQFYYNAINELVKVKNTKGYETHYTYDMAGRRIEEKHPDRGITKYTYNNAGALIEKQTANLMQPDQTGLIQYNYHYHRLTGIDYPHHPENNVAYTYGTGMAIGDTSNSMGRLIMQEDATGIQRFKYGKLGELTETLRGVAVAGKKSYWFKTQWEYDSWNRIHKITYPDDEEVTYHYDLAGQLNSMTRQIQGVNAPDIVKNITYTNYGERASVNYGNGTVTTYDYDIRRRMNNVAHTFNSFDIEKDYTYDPLSNITNISSSNSTSPATGALGGPVSHTYTYDDYNRLIHATGYYVGPGDETPDLLRQEYTLEMLYDVDHSILSKRQTHVMGTVNSLTAPINQEFPVWATSYDLAYDDYAGGSHIAAGYGYAQPHAPRSITELPNHNYDDDPNDPRIKRQTVDYDANGNMTAIRQQAVDPDQPEGTMYISLRKHLWDEEDRLRAVDLMPENDADKPEVASYTYDAAGERIVRYIPGRVDARYSAKETGNEDKLEAMLYPSPLLTVKALTIPPLLSTSQLENYTITKYTKHYYIGSERVSSALGTIKQLGLLCDSYDVTNAQAQLMDQKVVAAGEAIEADYEALGKEITLNAQVLYGKDRFKCRFAHDAKMFDAYWYHPDHLGSSSYITNLAGDINQHMEYLPFGETLVEEHLNSYNSPFKFNAKELDAETGNYYYGSRYYDPKFSLFLGVDQHYFNYPGISPYAYTANNPVKYIDPDGRDIEISYIYQQDKEGNYVLDNDGNRIVTGMNIDVTGKLINFSNNNVNMEDALSDIIAHIEGTYSGNFDGLEVKTTANISIANSMEDVAESDHLFVLAEPGSNNKWYKGSTASGAANNFGGMVAFLDADYFTGWFDTNFGKTGQRTASHELGHLFNLRHTNSGLMRSGGSGTSLSRGQFNSIMRSYDSGLLNQGPNHDMNGLPNQGILQGRGIFNMTNTAGRNKNVNRGQYFQRYYGNQ